MEVPAGETGSTPAAPRTFAAGDVVLSCEPWVCSFKYPYYKQLCAYCFKLSDKLMMCSNCQLHYYCGTECQTAEWQRDHKRECKMLKEISTKILTLNSSIEKDYDGEFGFCTAEILMAKIVNKIKSGKKERLAGFDGERTAREILELLPYDPCYENTFKQSDRFLHPIIWPIATLGNIPAGFYKLARKVYYNAFAIRDQVGKEEVFGAGLFPRALHRQMTPVCWDINVTMDIQRRTLVVHATEDIVSYAGLKDLRQNELLVNIFAISQPERRVWFEIGYFRPCTCKKCTCQYDAEINPLKCLTSGCTERIPSDHRALQPCSQCGAVNEHRLRQLEVLMKRNADMEKGVVERGERQYGLLLELDQADILHLDAHFRYVLGSNVLRFLLPKKRYEEAWKLCPGLVDCVRAIYPAYHLGRACVLRLAGIAPCMWYIQVRKDAIRSHWKDILDAKILDWLWEAREICRKLTGPDNQHEAELTTSLQLIGQITMEVTPEHLDQFHADWLRLQEG